MTDERDEHDVLDEAADQLSKQDAGGAGWNDDDRAFMERADEVVPDFHGESDDSGTPDSDDDDGDADLDDQDDDDLLDEDDDQP